MAGFRIRESGGDKRLYCGPDLGWIQDNPPPPPKPADLAVVYDTKEAAEKAIVQGGIKAVIEYVP
jgi:hypothetical protein